MICKHIENKKNVPSIIYKPLLPTHKPCLSLALSRLLLHAGCNRTHHFTVVVVRTRTQPFYPHPHCNRTCTHTQNIGKKRCSSIGMWGLILKHSLIAL